MCSVCGKYSSLTLLLQFGLKDGITCHMTFVKLQCYYIIYIYIQTLLFV